MYTCCPNCQTCFRITKPQLDVAQGHVRCGTCSKVFNAKQYLHDEIPGKPESKPKEPVKKVSPEVKPPRKTSSTQKPQNHPKNKKPEPPVISAPKENKNPLKSKAIKTGAASSKPATPDIDLFDYTSISRVQDATHQSNKADFAEQDINDIFDDLESQHALRQPNIPIDNSSDSQEEPETVISADSQAAEQIVITDNEQKDEDNDTPIEDTALIDISSMEDEWLKELTSEVKTNDSGWADKSKSVRQDITKPIPKQKPVPPKAKAQEKPKSITIQPESKKSARYEYVDPSELLKEEKGINEILQDMNRQLSLEIDPSIPEHFEDSNDKIEITTPKTNTSSTLSSSGTETDESDISGMFKHAMLETNKNPAPDTTKIKDDFESSFLASLDSATLNSAQETQTNTEVPQITRPKKTTRADINVNIGPTQNTSKKDLDLKNESRLPELPGSEEDVPYQLRDVFDEDTPHRNAKVWSIYIASAILLMTLASLQLIIFRSTDLVDNFPSLEPTLSDLCNTLPCRYTGPRDVSQVKLLSRDIRIHPKEEKALLITATMINRAKFKQPYPDIKITLSDLSGDVVARRQFPAEQYLKRIYSPLLRMPSGQPVKIALEVIDPGRDAVNFEFTFH